MILPDVNHVQSKFVDDLLFGVTDLRLVSVGLAKYEITATLPHGREVLIVLRTAQKGRICTSIETGRKAIAQLRYELSAEGTLSLLEIPSCSMHLEQMSRGHYWLGLTTAGQDTVHINFTTPGYLKVTAAERAENSPTGA
jgi:hypothetical protein